MNAVGLRDDASLFDWLRWRNFVTVRKVTCRFSVGALRHGQYSIKCE
jgi:hypothetical protein